MNADVQIVQACQQILGGLQTLDQALPRCSDPDTLRMLSQALRHLVRRCDLLEHATFDRRDRISDAHLWDVYQAPSSSEVQS